MAQQLKSLIEKIEQALDAELAEFRSGLEPAERSDRVLGFIVSADFENSEHADRQNRLKSILSNLLDAEEILLVGPIVTMTPDEANIGDSAA